MQVKVIGLFCLLGLGIACTGNKRTGNKNFDSRQFFETEIKRLEASKKGILKTMVFEGKEQLLEIKDTVNWPTELRSFTEINLATDAYTDLFTVDSIRADEQLTVRYLPKEQEEEIKEVTLVYTQSRITLITAVLSADNSLYKTRKTLRYNPDSGYVVSGDQQVNRFSNTSYTVGGKWLD